MNDTPDSNGARLRDLPVYPTGESRADGHSDRIWRLLIEARHHDWAGHPTLRAALPGGELALQRSGDWHADIHLDESAGALLDALAPLACADRIVVGQLGQSLDGRIATRTGHSRYINGPAGLSHLHRLRALVDAVVVGAETACADHPRLTVRHVAGPDPTPVIVDPRGRVPAEGPLFENGAQSRRVLHLIADEAEVEPAPGSVERVPIPLRQGGFAPADILTALQEHGLRRILIEGGADTLSRFMDADALDQLHLLIAPLIIGSGRNGIDLPAIDRLDQARRPSVRSFALGDELLVDVQLGARQG